METGRRQSHWIYHMMITNFLVGVSLPQKEMRYMPSTLKTVLRQCQLRCLHCPSHQPPLHHHLQLRFLLWPCCQPTLHHNLQAWLNQNHHLWHHHHPYLLQRYAIWLILQSFMIGGHGKHRGSFKKSLTTMVVVMNAVFDCGCTVAHAGMLLLLCDFQ